MVRRMRRACAALLLLAAALLLTACGHGPDPAATMATDTTAPIPVAPSTEETPLLDLSTQSATLAYAALCDLLMSPEDHLGQTVRMDGVCSTYQDALTGEAVPICTVADGPGCCTQGIEYVLAGGGTYPPDGTAVLLTGVFEAFDLNGATWYHLADATIE